MIDANTREIIVRQADQQPMLVVVVDTKAEFDCISATSRRAAGVSCDRYSPTLGIRRCLSVRNSAKLRSFLRRIEQYPEFFMGEIGGRLHLSWRLRVRPAPFGIGDGWHVIEQQAYADAGDTIDALDLLCSGFHADRIGDHS